jgi:hypothetical protein
VEKFKKIRQFKKLVTDHSEFITDIAVTSAVCIAAGIVGAYVARPLVNHGWRVVNGKIDYYDDERIMTILYANGKVHQLVCIDVSES